MTQAEITTLTSEIAKSTLANAALWNETNVAGQFLITADRAEHLGAVLLAARAAFRSDCSNVTLALPSELIVPALTVCPEATALALPAAGELQPTAVLSFGNAQRTAAAQVVLYSPFSESLLPQMGDQPANSVALLDMTGQTGHAEETDAALLRRIAGSAAKAAVAIGSSATVAVGEKLFKPEERVLGHAGGAAVLAGIIGGLLAQKLTLEQAVVCGAHLQALAGSAAAKGGSEASVMGRDLLEHLPGALNYLRRTCDPKRGESRPGLRRSL